MPHTKYHKTPEQIERSRWYYYSAGTWEKATFRSICPTALVEPAKSDLESVSIYQTIDLLCEGEIAGLCDKHGNLIKITSDSNKNEDGFKGIYLNDVPVKNTDVNTLNYNRAFADFRIGASQQRQLSSFENDSLSFTNAVQTLNINAKLPGLNKDNAMIKNKSDKFIIYTADSNDDVGETKSGTQSVDIAPRYDHRYGATLSNAAYPVLNNDAIARVRAAEKAQVISIHHIITNDSATMAQIDMAIPGNLTKVGGKGLIHPAAVNFIIKVGYVDDELTIQEGGSIQYIYCSIYGRTNAGYVRSHNIPLPHAAQDIDRFVKIFRVDQELGIEYTRLNKSLNVAHISEIVRENFNYPHSALMGMIVDGRAFSQPPVRRFDVKMINYKAEARRYEGDWDGEFGQERQWTDNPAWVFYDLATNTRYGVGKYGFKAAYLDKWNLYSISKYCDALVPSGYSGKFPKMPFSIAPNGITVSFDDSSSNLGEKVFNSRFPKGETVCFFETKGGPIASGAPSGTSVDTSYKRIIFNPSYSGSTFSFTLVKEIDVEKVFEDYPQMKVNFLRQQQDAIKASKEFLVNYLFNQQSSNDPFVVEYIGGEPLGDSIRSGYATTQFATFLPLLEPRFSINIYLDKKQNAFNALNDIAAVFRGMIYWSSGYMFVANDEKKDAIMLFTNANVKDGLFSYSGSASTARSTAVTVRFNDAGDSYKPKVEYIEDAAGIRQYGYIEKEAIALGVTSRAQAHRLGKWMLFTNQTEIDTIQFTTGQEGSYLRPADVIKVQDKLKSAKRYGGRIKDIDYAAKTITLDKGIQQNIDGEKITCMVPKGNTTVRALNKAAGEKVANNKLLLGTSSTEVGREGMTPEEVSKTRQTQIKQFTIASVSEDNVVTISETEDQDFNLIKRGTIWSVQNTGASFEIEEIEYRVLSVLENSSNEYQVSGMMYNRTKFDAVDQSKSIENTQQSKTQIIEVGGLPTALSDSTPSGITQNFVSIEEGTVLPVFNAKFPFSTTSASNDEYIKVKFESLIGVNSITAQNTGGYIINLFRGTGNKVTFALDGYDNTTFYVLLGSGVERSNVCFQIYRYDTSFKLESTGL